MRVPTPFFHIRRANGPSRLNLRIVTPGRRHRPFGATWFVGAPDLGLAPQALFPRRFAATNRNPEGVWEYSLGRKPQVRDSIAPSRPRRGEVNSALIGVANAQTIHVVC
jgi:hypothetical protein